MVGTKAMINSVTPAEIFGQNDLNIGEWASKENSIVPVLRSSAIDLMVMAGMRIRNITGERLKNGIKSASCPSNKLVLSATNHRKIPDAIR